MYQDKLEKGKINKITKDGESLPGNRAQDKNTTYSGFRKGEKRSYKKLGV